MGSLSGSVDDDQAHFDTQVFLWYRIDNDSDNFTLSQLITVTATSEMI